MNFLDFCKTDLQRKVIAVWEDHGYVNASVYKALPDVSERTIRKIILAVKTRANEQGFSPQHDLLNPVPDTHKATRVTTAYKNGEPVMQWVRAEMELNPADEFDWSKITDAFKAEVQPYKPKSPPKHIKQDLLNCYVITDYHLGMLAEARESGDDWDLKKAEDTLVEWITQAVALSPDAEEGLFMQLGDGLHFDGHLPVTPSHGHILDTSCRPHDMVAAACRVFRLVCDVLLTKHKKVRVMCCTGNHDIYSSIWLRELLNHVYSNEPRLSVDMSPDVYYAYKFGDVGIYAHHGHKKRMGQVSDVFVRKFREIFGKTKHSYAHLGHLHHIDKSEKENNLMVLEQHRTLAASDSHASLGGWLSGRSASVITYHRAHGEVCRYTLSSTMVEPSVPRNEALISDLSSTLSDPLEDIPSFTQPAATSEDS